MSNRKGTLRSPPHLMLRHSSFELTPEKYREASHNSKVFLTSHRHHEKLPEVTIATQEKPNFPAAT